jgi:hypothetical protein
VTVRPTPALGDTEDVAQGLGEALGEEAKLFLGGVGKQIVRVGEESGTHVELGRFGDVSQTGYASAASVSDQKTRLCLKAGPGQEPKRATRTGAHQAASTPSSQYGPAAVNVGVGLASSRRCRRSSWATTYGRTATVEAPSMNVSAR